MSVMSKKESFHFNQETSSSAQLELLPWTLQKIHPAVYRSLFEWSTTWCLSRTTGEKSFIEHTQRMNQVLEATLPNKKNSLRGSTITKMEADQEMRQLNSLDNAPHPQKHCQVDF